jgi:hypothetical protein
MARCTRCGAWNPDYVQFCGKCGGEVVKDAGDSSYPPPAPVRDKRICAWCGKEVGEAVTVCPFCGRDLAAPAGTHRSAQDIYTEPYYPVTHRSTGASGTLILGAIFALLAGVMALGQGLLYMVVGSAVGSYAPGGFICFCGGLDFVFGLASIAAGVFALQRKSFMLCVIGAVLGMLGLGLLIGFVFGLIALILIAISKEEFSS